MKPVNPMKILDRLRENLRQALQSKTGWGRAEDLQEFDRAATRAVADEYHEASSQNDSPNVAD
jgi:hypothetical protein